MAAITPPFSLSCSMEPGALFGGGVGETDVVLRLELALVVCEDRTRSAPRFEIENESSAQSR